jgi:hypothetical protein
LVTGPNAATASVAVARSVATRTVTQIHDIEVDLVKVLRLRSTAVTPMHAKTMTTSKTTEVVERKGVSNVKPLLNTVRNTNPHQAPRRKVLRSAGFALDHKTAGIPSAQMPRNITTQVTRIRTDPVTTPI